MRIFVAMLLVCSIVMPYSVFAVRPQSQGTSPIPRVDETWSIEDESKGEADLFFNNYQASGKHYRTKIAKKCAAGILMVPAVAVGGYCAATYAAVLTIGIFFQGVNGITHSFSAKKYFNFTKELDKAKKIVYASLSEEQQDHIDKEFKYPFEKIVIQDSLLDSKVKAERIELRNQKTQKFLNDFLQELKAKYPEQSELLTFDHLKYTISTLAASGALSEVLDEVEEEKTLLSFHKVILDAFMASTQTTVVEATDFTAQTYEKYTHRAERFQKQSRNKKLLAVIMVPSLAGGITASVLTGGILSFVPVIEVIAGVRATIQSVKKNRISKVMKTVTKLIVASFEPQDRERLLESFTDDAKKQKFIEKSEKKLKDLFDELNSENSDKNLDINMLKSKILELAQNGALLKIRKTLEITRKLDALKILLSSEMRDSDEGDVFQNSEIDKDEVIIEAEPSVTDTNTTTPFVLSDAGLANS